MEPFDDANGQPGLGNEQSPTKVSIDATEGRFGTCVAYGPSAGIGLPIKVAEQRPLVMVHPCAHAHYHASHALVADGGHPFLQFIVDFGDHSPDAWGVNASVAGTATHVRLVDSTAGHKVYRQADLATPHWQVHAVGEALETLGALPPVDILYVDWLSWMNPEGYGEPLVFLEAMRVYAHKIRDGGLVVLDHKHHHLNGGPVDWFTFPESPTFEVLPGIEMVNEGTVEWLGPDLYGECQSHSASVFSVHHTAPTASEASASAAHENGGGAVSVGQATPFDWDKAMRAWFEVNVPELRFGVDGPHVHPSPNSLASAESIPSLAHHHLHPNALTVEQWMDLWMMVNDEHEGDPELPLIPAEAVEPEPFSPRFRNWFRTDPLA